MSMTKILKVDPQRPALQALEEAARILSGGGLVIIPTETVYGIAACMSDKKAVERLYAIKKRPLDKPFSLHIATKDKVEEFAANPPVAAYKLMEKFWPGPLTLVFWARPEDPLTRGFVDRSTIGIRLPDDKVAQAVIALAGVPVVCPSANLTGEPPPINFSAALKDLSGLVDCAIDTGPTRLGLESSIVDVTVEPLRILRLGAIKNEAIQEAVQRKTVLFICTGNSCRSVMAEGLLRKRLADAGRNDVEVVSAGIIALNGLSASPETRALLARDNIDVSSHHSQRATRELVRRSDLILVMERLHEAQILMLCPEVKKRVFLLKEFARIGDTGLDIKDPISTSEDFYAQIYQVIKEAVERVAGNI